MDILSKVNLDINLDTVSKLIEENMELNINLDINLDIMSKLFKDWLYSQLSDSRPEKPLRDYLRALR